MTPFPQQNRSFFPNCQNREKTSFKNRRSESPISFNISRVKRQSASFFNFQQQSEGSRFEDNNSQAILENVSIIEQYKQIFSNQNKSTSSQQTLIKMRFKKMEKELDVLELSQGQLDSLSENHFKEHMNFMTKAVSHLLQNEQIKTLLSRSLEDLCNCHSLMDSQNQNKIRILALQKAHIQKVLKASLLEISLIKENEIAKEQRLKTMFERIAMLDREIDEFNENDDIMKAIMPPVEEGWDQMVKERTNIHRNMKILEFELSQAAIHVSQDLEISNEHQEVQGLEATYLINTIKDGIQGNIVNLREKILAIIRNELGRRKDSQVFMETQTDTFDADQQSILIDKMQRNIDQLKKDNMMQRMKLDKKISQEIDKEERILQLQDKLEKLKESEWHLTREVSDRDSEIKGLKQQMVKKDKEVKEIQQQLNQQIEKTKQQELEFKNTEKSLNKKIEILTYKQYRGQGGSGLNVNGNNNSSLNSQKDIDDCKGQKSTYRRTGSKPNEVKSNNNSISITNEDELRSRSKFDQGSLYLAKPNSKNNKQNHNSQVSQQSNAKRKGSNASAADMKQSDSKVEFKIEKSSNQNKRGDMSNKSHQNKGGGKSPKFTMSNSPVDSSKQFNFEQEVAHHHQQKQKKRASGFSPTSPMQNAPPQQLQSKPSAQIMKSNNNYLSPSLDTSFDESGQINYPHKPYNNHRNASEIKHNKAIKKNAQMNTDSHHPHLNQEFTIQEESREEIAKFAEAGNEKIIQTQSPEKVSRSTQTRGHHQSTSPMMHPLSNFKVFVNKKNYENELKKFEKHVQKPVIEVNPAIITFSYTPCRRTPDHNNMSHKVVFSPTNDPHLLNLQYKSKIRNQQQKANIANSCNAKGPDKQFLQQAMIRGSSSFLMQQQEQKLVGPTTILKDDPPPTPWTYYFFGSLLFYGGMAPICYLMKILDTFDIKTDSQLFGDFYYRYYVWTDFMPVSQLLFYVIALGVGFAFINVVNLDNVRKNPFKDGEGKYKSFKQTICYAIVFFFISGLVILRQKYDFSNYCITPEDNAVNQFRAAILPPTINHTHAVTLQSPLHKIFYSIDQMEYTSFLDSSVIPECREIQDTKVFQFNYLVWTLFFFIGLQFTHLDNGILQQFTLDWEVMKNWPPILWVLFFLLIGFIIGTFAFLFYLYAAIGIALYYAIVLVGIIGGIALITYLYSDHYELHVHHYILGMFVMIMLCYQNVYISAIHAIFNGVFIEGGCRWGFAPMYEYHEDPPKQNTAPTAIQLRKKAIVLKQLQSKVREENFRKTQVNQNLQQQISAYSSTYLESPFITSNQTNISALPKLEYAYSEQPHLNYVNQTGKISQASMMV